MKLIWFMFFIVGTLTSCQYFETEKISTEKFYEEEVKSINWKDVDQYPVFSDCKHLTEKKEQKVCFENTLSAHLYHTMSSRNISSNFDINDTIFLEFSVDKQSRLTLSNIEMDSIVSDQFPQMEEWFFESIDSLQPEAPALKRGIPVKTEFKLPIVVRTAEL